MERRDERWDLGGIFAEERVGLDCGFDTCLWSLGSREEATRR